MEDNEIKRKAEQVEEPMPTFPEYSGTLADLCNALAPSIPFAFKYGAAFTRFGLALSGRTTLEGEEHLQPRFYTALLGMPGSGKNAALNETAVIDRGIDQYTTRNDYLQTGSIDSGPALVDTFVEVNGSNGDMCTTPARVLLANGELSGVFEKAKTSDKSRNSLFTELLELYEANITGNRSRTNNVGDVRNAHLAIIGGIQPKVYEAMWSGTRAAAGGLQSRFTIIGSDLDKVPMIQKPTDIRAVVEAMGEIHAQLTNAPRTVRFTKGATDILTDWWNAQQEQHDHSVTTRVHDMAKRFAIVYTVSLGKEVADEAVALKACEFGAYQIVMRERFNPEDSTNNVQAFELLIVRTLTRRGKLPRAKLCDSVNGYTNHGGLGPFGEAVRNLIREQRIADVGKTRKGAPVYDIVLAEQL